MPKKKTELQKSVGKLISAIQKEWIQYAGEPIPEQTAEEVMNAAHCLAMAQTIDKIRGILGERTVSEYLGESWVQEHPNVIPFVTALEYQLNL